MEMQQEKESLLIYLLEVISEACTEVEVIEPDTDNPLYEVKTNVPPIFELGDDDIEVIKRLSKYEPRLQELLERIESAKG